MVIGGKIKLAIKPQLIFYSLGVVTISKNHFCKIKEEKNEEEID